MLCKRDTEALEVMAGSEALWCQWRWIFKREFWGCFKLGIHRIKGRCEPWDRVQSFLWQTQHRNPSKTEQAPADNWELGTGNLQRIFALVIKNTTCAVCPGCSSLLLLSPLSYNLICLVMHPSFWFVFFFLITSAIMFSCDLMTVFLSVKYFLLPQRQLFIHTNTAQGGGEFLAAFVCLNNLLQLSSEKTLQFG